MEDVVVLLETFAVTQYQVNSLTDGFRLKEWGCSFAPGRRSDPCGRARRGVLIAWKASCFTPCGDPEILLLARILRQQLQHISGSKLHVVGCYGPQQGSEEVSDFWSTLTDSVTDMCVVTGDLNAHLDSPYTESDMRLADLVDEEFGILVDVGHRLAPLTPTYASGTYQSRIDYMLASRPLSESWTSFKVLACGKKHRALIAEMVVDVEMEGRSRPQGVRNVRKILPKSCGGKDKLHQIYQELIMEEFQRSGHLWDLAEGQKVLRDCAVQTLDNSIQIHCRTLEGARQLWTSWRGRRKHLDSLVGFDDRELQSRLKAFVDSNWSVVRQRVKHKTQCVCNQRFKDTFNLLQTWCGEQEMYWWKVYEGRRKAKHDAEEEAAKKLEIETRQRGLAAAFRWFKRGRRGAWEPISQLHLDDNEEAPQKKIGWGGDSVVVQTPPHFA